MSPKLDKPNVKLESNRLFWGNEEAIRHAADLFLSGIRYEDVVAELHAKFGIDLKLHHFHSNKGKSNVRQAILHAYPNTDEETIQTVVGRTSKKAIYRESARKIRARSSYDQNMTPSVVRPADLESCSQQIKNMIENPRKRVRERINNIISVTTLYDTEMSERKIHIFVDGNVDQKLSSAWFSALRNQLRAWHQTKDIHQPAFGALTTLEQAHKKFSCVVRLSRLGRDAATASVLTAAGYMEWPKSK